MRGLSQELRQHIQSEVTTLATCWRIERQDGMVLGFTDHDQALEISGIRYDSIAGFTPTNVQSSNNMAVDNVDVAGGLYETKITAKDLLAGIYDFARVEIFLVNYENPNSGKLVQKTGVLGEVTLQGNMFHAEIRGLAQHLSQTICETYTPHCRANLGDNRCRFNLNQPGFTVHSSVSNTTNRQSFSAAIGEQNGWFVGGYVEWNSGLNQGLKMEVKEYSINQVTLVLPMSYNIEVGDNFTIVTGCDKEHHTCRTKFKNIINFRGEPHIPGTDRITAPARKQTRFY